MTIFRSWTFVNMAAALSGVVTFGLLTIPSKLQAEPNLIGLFALPMVVAAGIWLAAAMLRHWLLR